MLYVNTRHQLPQIGIRQQLSTLDSHAVQPRPESTGYRTARSNKGVTMPTIQIDSYPSRHAYGMSTMGDFTRDRGQQGFSDLQSSTSGHTQTAWAMIDKAARKGNDEIANQAHSKLAREVKKQRYIEIRPIPKPTITVTPGRVVGTPDEGNTRIRINTSASADVKFNRGVCETYLQQKGFIEHYVTEGHYDTYA